MYLEHFANIVIGEHPKCIDCDGYGFITGFFQELTDDGEIIYEHHRSCPSCGGKGYHEFIIDRRTYKRCRRYGFSQRALRTIFILGLRWRRFREKLYRAFPASTDKVEKLDTFVRFKLSPKLWLCTCLKESK